MHNYKHLDKLQLRNPHADGKIDSDFGSRVLAHAFYPLYNYLAGDVHVNDARTWTKKLSLLEVFACCEQTFVNFDSQTLAHELGHSLGLKHTEGKAGENVYCIILS